MNRTPPAAWKPASFSTAREPLNASKVNLVGALWAAAVGTVVVIVVVIAVAAFVEAVCSGRRWVVDDRRALADE
jgi:hypothetical protein